MGRKVAALSMAAAVAAAVGAGWLRGAAEADADAEFMRQHIRDQGARQEPGRVLMYAEPAGGPLSPDAAGSEGR